MIFTGNQYRVKHTVLISLQVLCRNYKCRMHLESFTWEVEGYFYYFTISHLLYSHFSIGLMVLPAVA